MSTPLVGVWELVVTSGVVGNTWNNTFAIQSRLEPSGDPPAPTHAIVTAMISFYRSLLQNGFQVIQAELRNIPDVPGTLPIADEAPIWTLQVEQPGTRDTLYQIPIQNTPLDIRAVAYLKKANRGRVGKQFLRGLLYEGDVQAIAGGHWTFTAGTQSFNVAQFNAISAPGIAPYLAAGSDPDYVLAVVHKKNQGLGGNIVDEVTSVVASNGTWHRGA